MTTVGELTAGILGAALATSSLLLYAHLSNERHRSAAARARVESAPTAEGGRPKQLWGKLKTASKVVSALKLNVKSISSSSVWK